MPLIGLVAIIAAIILLLILLVGSIYLIGEWTRRFWTEALWIFLCLIIAYFVIDFGLAYAGEIYSKIHFKE